MTMHKQWIEETKERFSGDNDVLEILEEMECDTDLEVDSFIDGEVSVDSRVAGTLLTLLLWNDGRELSTN